MKVLPANPDHRCQAFLERLSRYLDGELASADRRAIEAHLRDCPCCEDVLASLRQTIDLCREERAELPDDLRLRARARVAELLQRPVRAKPKARRS
jgi:anti-sigma factor RsiW